MFKNIIIGLSVIAFTLITVNKTGSAASYMPYTTSIYQSVNTDDITYELKYLYDKSGKKYAAEICLKNNTDKYLRVHWTLTNGINTNIPSDEGTKDISPNTKLCLATVFPVDPEKSWDPGVFKFDWEQI
ncbi:MAG: hypothetical protein PHN88_16135 [Ignavibacteria bacterium]|nr:hypothetical protein [Ignavibacteria bacterium]